jgi:hypothetical protein
MRPNFSSQTAQRFTASYRRYPGLLSIFSSCGLAWQLGDYPLSVVAFSRTREVLLLSSQDVARRGSHRSTSARRQFSPSTCFSQS